MVWFNTDVAGHELTYRGDCTEQEDPVALTVAPDDAAVEQAKDFALEVVDMDCLMEVGNRAGYRTQLLTRVQSEQNSHLLRFETKQLREFKAELLNFILQSMRQDKFHCTRA